MSRQESVSGEIRERAPGRGDPPRDASFPEQQSKALAIGSWAERQILQRLDALEARVEQIGLEIGLITKIMMDASAPAQEMTDQEFSAQLDHALSEIFQGAQSLPFDEALRRAAALMPSKPAAPKG